MSDKTEKKYMKKSEIVTFGIGLFGVALMTGWMPDYTATFFADFAFKGKGFDSATMANAISMVFLVAGIIGAVCELVIGYLVDNTRTKLGKVKPWVGFGVVPLAVVAMLVFIAPNTSNQTLAIVWMFVIYSLYTAFSCAEKARLTASAPCARPIRQSAPPPSPSLRSCAAWASPAVWSS